MKIHAILPIYNLFEANIFNIKDEYEGVSIAGYLKQFVQNLPGVILQQQFTKKVAHLLVNDERFHYAVRQLPAGAPEWAQKAVAAEQLFAFRPTAELNDTLSHITHYLAAAAEDSVRSPSPDQKVVAARSLAALPKAENIDTIKQHADEYFKRGSRKAERDVSGAEQIFDAGQGYLWYKLTAQEAYRREGKVLQNCIGTIYTHARAEKDKQAIVVLKSPSNESIVAMRIGVPNKEMEEVKGKNNRPPIPKYMPPVIKFINHMGLTPSRGAMYDLKNAGYYYDEPSKKLYTRAEAIQQLVKTTALDKVAGGLTLVKANITNPELFNDLYGALVGHSHRYYGGYGSTQTKHEIYELRDANNAPRATAIVSGEKLLAVTSHQPQSNQQPAVQEATAQKESKPTSTTMLLTTELLKRGIVTSLEQGIQRQMLWKDKMAWNPEKGSFEELSTQEPEVATDKKHMKWKVYSDPTVVKQLFSSLQKADRYGADPAVTQAYQARSIDKIYVDSHTDLVSDEDGDGEGDGDEGQAQVTYMILKTKDGVLLPVRAVFARGEANVLDKNAGFKGVNSWQRGERDPRTVASLMALANKQGLRLPKTVRINHGIVRSGDQYVQYEPKLEKVDGKIPASKISMADLSYGDRLSAMSYLGTSKHTPQAEHTRDDDTFSVQSAIKHAVGRDRDLTDITKWEKGELDKVYQKVFGVHTPETIYLVDITYGTDKKDKVALMVDKNTIVRVDNKTAGDKWQKWSDYDTVADQLNQFAAEHNLKFAPRALFGMADTGKHHAGELRVSDGKLTSAATEKRKFIEQKRERGRYAMEGTDELTFADGTKMQRMAPGDQAQWVRQTMRGEGGRGEGWKIIDKNGKAQAIITVDGKNLMTMYGQGYGDEEKINLRGLVIDMLPYVKAAKDVFKWNAKGRSFLIRAGGKMQDVLDGYNQGPRRRQWLRDFEKQAIKYGWLRIDPTARVNTRVPESRRSRRIEITEQGKAALRRLKTGTDLSHLDQVTAAELPKEFVAPTPRELPKKAPTAGTGKWKVSTAVPREGSKAESALEKFRQMATDSGRMPTRSEFMQVMMQAPYNMSKFGAQTYYYTTKAKYAALGETFSQLAAYQLKNDPILKSFRRFLVD